MVRRVLNIIVGVFTLGVVSLEERHPEILLAKLEKDTGRQVERAKENLIKAKVSLKVAHKQEADVQGQSEFVQKRIGQAIAQADEELLTHLYIEEAGMQKSLEAAQKFRAKIEEIHNKIENEYKIVRSEASAKLTKIEMHKRQAEMNKARKRALVDLDIDLPGMAQDTKRVEDILAKQEYDVEAREEVQEKSIEKSLRRMEMSAELEAAREKARNAIAGVA